MQFIRPKRFTFEQLVKFHEKSNDLASFCFAKRVQTTIPALDYTWRWVESFGALHSAKLSTSSGRRLFRLARYRTLVPIAAQKWVFRVVFEAQCGEDRRTNETDSSKDFKLNRSPQLSARRPISGGFFNNPRSKLTTHRREWSESDYLIWDLLTVALIHSVDMLLRRQVGERLIFRLGSTKNSTFDRF